jgi:hypothetical protein
LKGKKEFYCSLEESVPERVAPVVFRLPQRREFPGEQTVGVFSGGIQNTQSISGNCFFTPAVFYSRRAPHGCNCSEGNPPPRGNPGLQRIRTDTILKKFEFKMNFKLKINIKRDRTNFISIQ